MAELREVRILIGKRSYRMQTALDESALAQVTALAAEVSESIGDGVDQENLLLLTCLQLSYSLEKMSGRLNRLLERLKCLEPLDFDSEI